RRWVVHAGGEAPLGGGLSVLPAAIAMGQGPHNSITAGANFRYTNRDWRELAFRVGAWAHLSNQLQNGMGMDAIVATAVLEMERWNIGFSYDITTSVLAQANNSRGAFEVSFV
ncbi:type IX secretion system membrane protein PorP/SprF, partial [Arthrospira platensis SPKY1]|nr:type IX secretion system membrane protein PorP/SprF [Arthrospira platensis SPKY1]